MGGIRRDPWWTIEIHVTSLDENALGEEGFDSADTTMTGRGKRGDRPDPPNPSGPSDRTAVEFWGEHATRYDDFIRRIVPRYDEMTERLLESLPADVERVLELGCGTGNLSLLLAERLPSASFTFVDAAPEMLEIARGRLRAAHPEVEARASFLKASFESYRPEPTTFDLAVSSLSLHHVRDLAPVYAAIGRSLASGGHIRITDGVLAALPEQQRLNLDRWERFWREGGRVSEEEIAEVLDHLVLHDHYVPLEEHFRMLRAAGFVRCDCIWRDGLFAVMSAVRG